MSHLLRINIYVIILTPQFMTDLNEIRMGFIITALRWSKLLSLFLFFYRNKSEPSKHNSLCMNWLLFPTKIVDKMYVLIVYEISTFTLISFYLWLKYDIEVL